MPKHKLVRITTVPIGLYTLLDGQLRFMSGQYDVIGISSEGEFLELAAKREGITVKVVEMTRRISPLKDLKAVLSLYTIFKKEKPLIVHTHSPKAGIVGLLAAKLAGVKVRLHTVAGLPLLESKGIKRRLLNGVEKLTYSFATRVYPNSYLLKEIILNSRFCKAAKLKVIGEGSTNGINTTFFSAIQFSEYQKLSLKKDLQIQMDDFVFIFVGRLVSHKGVNELVSAFDKISRENNKVKLLLVGSQEAALDPLSATTLELINKNSGIISAGYQMDVRLYFAIANALVFPSYREGFPNVVMQAGAMGLPSIVTNINGCKEIIIDKKNGLIIEPKDIPALENAMQLFIKNKELLLTLKNNARNMIEERYEQQNIWNELLIEYKEFEDSYQLK